MAGGNEMRSAQPWYRASEDRWYVWLRGKQRSLGVRGKGNQKLAFEAWHRLCLEPVEDRPPEAPKPVADNVAATVAGFVDAYLAQAKTHLKPDSLAVLRGR
jgi:hypothetical protein